MRQKNLNQTVEPIRVLLCASSMSSGGSERQLLNLLKGLDRKRFQPSLYLLYREGPLLREVPSDVPIYDFWSKHQHPRWNWPGRIHAWQKKDLRQLCRQLNIDVVYERLLHMALLAGPALRGTGVAHIATLVSPPSRDLPHTDKRFGWLKRIVLRRSYSEANRILAVSRATATDASSFYGLDPSRIEVVPSPTDIKNIDRLRSEPWPGKPVNRKFKNLVCVGRLSSEKGQADLLAAFANAARTLKSNSPSLDLHLHFVGEGPDLSSLELKARELAIQESVTFHGFTSNPYSLLSQCDLLCLPSHYEGLPNVLLESLVCGVPFLSTLSSLSVSELMEKTYRKPLPQPKDIDAIASLIVDRFRSPAEWEGKRAEGRTYVESHHSLERWLEKIQGLLSSAVEEGRKARQPQ